MKPITKQRKGTKKHIAKVCLEVYEKVLEEGKKDNLERFKKKLSKEYCDFGVCKLYVSITGYDQISQYIISYAKPIFSDGTPLHDHVSRIFWFKVPYHAESKKEAIDLIKKRMEILKNW